MPPRDSCMILRVQYPVKLIGTVKVSVKEKVSKILREVVQRFPKYFNRKEIANMRVAIMGRLISNEERLERFKSGDIIMIVKGVTTDMPKCPVHELEMLCYTKKHQYMLCHTCWTVQDHHGVSHSENDQYIISIGDLPEAKRKQVIEDARSDFNLKLLEETKAPENGVNGQPAPDASQPSTFKNHLDLRGIPKTIPSPVRTNLALEAAQKNLLAPLHQAENVDVQNAGSMFPLLYAVHNQNEEIVSCLLAKGANVNQRTFKGLTSLIAAAHLGNSTIVSMLLEEGHAQPDAQTKDGTTALIAAASNKKSSHLNLLTLLQHGASVNLAKDNGTTALMCSAEINDFIGIKILIRNGAYPGTRQINGLSALAIATTNNHLESARTLLRADAPMSLDFKGNTLLALAGKHASPEMMQLFLDNGVDPNQRNHNGCAPIALTCSSKWAVDNAKLYLSAGAIVDGSGKCDILRHIILNGGKQLLYTLWDSGVNLDYERLLEAASDFRDKSMLNFIVERTPEGVSFGNSILRAVEANDKKTVEMLVERCSHADSLRMAFTESLRVKSTPIMQMLLANENLTKPSEGKLMTPLMTVAAETGNSKLVRMLLEMGFDKTEVDIHGRNALHYAKAHKVAFALLREPDERLQCLDVNNESALMNAVRHGNVDTVKLLINLGFDAKSRNTDGDTPAHVAARSSCLSTLRMVLGTYKANPQEGMVPNGEEMTPLTISCLRGAPMHVLEVLSQLNPTQEQIAESLHAAVKAGKASAVEKLIAQLKVPIGPFLETCATTDNMDIMKILLQVWKEQEGKWVVAEAVLKSDARGIFEMLIAPLELLNKLLKEKTKNGETLMHVAAQHGACKCIDMLVDCGVAVDTVDAEGKTPLMAAANAGHLDAIRKLVETYSAPLSPRCAQSRNAAMYSVLSNNSTAVRYFVKPKPKQSKTTSEELELMNLAIENELEDMVHTLALFPDG